MYKASHGRHFTEKVSSQHRHIFFISVTCTNPTTRQNNRNRLKMTNNKLQVLCLFVLTICTVMNNVRSKITRRACCNQIYITNHMISILDDGQKYKLVQFLVNEHKSVVQSNPQNNGEFTAVDMGFPPGIDLLKDMNEDDTKYVYDTTYINEQRIQSELKKYILESYESDWHEAGHKVDLDDIDSFNKAVMNRRKLLNLIFRYVLNDRLGNVQMCVDNENMKCVLVGLISRTIKYQSRNRAKCNCDGTCTVISVVRVIDPTVLFNSLPQNNESYRDWLYDTANEYYQTVDHPELRTELTVEALEAGNPSNVE